MFAVKLKVIEILKREQILEYALSCDAQSFEKLCALYFFQENELQILKEYCLKKQGIYLKILKFMEEIQTGNKETFKRYHKYLYN